MSTASQTARLVILHVPGCPNLAPLLEGVTQVTNLPVIHREVTTEAEARELGMAGSPTLLVDGVDPFALADGCASGLSCRLYRDPQGRIVPAPSIDQLRAAIAITSH